MKRNKERENGVFQKGIPKRGRGSERREDDDEKI